MPGNKKVGATCIYIITSTLLVLSTFGPALGTISTIDTFSDGGLEAAISFEHGGGWNNSTSISIERAERIYSANITLTPGPIIEDGLHEAGASGISANASSSNLTLWNGNVTLGETSGQWRVADDAELNQTNLTDIEVSAGARLTMDRYGVWAHPADGSLPGRDSQSVLWDVPGNRMLVYGGHTFSGGDLFFNDMWYYYPTTNTWQNVYINLADAPDKGRCGHTTVLNTDTNVMILNGGYYNNASLGWNIIHTVWFYNLTSDEWNKMSDAPRDRTNHTAVWDPDGKRMIVFGGITTVGAATPPTNDLWFYLPSSDTWIPMADGPFVGRSEHTAVWDNANHQMLVFGGIGQSGQIFSDTWAYHTSNDTWVRRADAPVPLFNHSAVWDADNRQMLVLGPNNKFLVYYPDNNTWEQRPDPPYISRGAQSAIMDQASYRMVMFGGNSTAGAHLPDAWTYTMKYHQVGSLVSAPMMLPYPHVLGKVQWTATLAANTGVKAAVRSSPDNTTWSTWEEVTSGTAPLLTQPNRFLQWRANLSTTDGKDTPILTSISMNYTLWNVTGILVSRPIMSPGNIVNATLHLNATLNGGSIALWLSADNGSHWEPAVANTTHTMGTHGKALAYKMQFNASPDGRSPVLGGILIDYVYESLPTDLSLQIADIAIDIGNLTAPAKVDISQALDLAITDNASFPGPLNLTLAFHSSSSGTLNLSELLISYEFIPVDFPPTISDPYPANNSEVQRTDVTLSWNASDPEGDNMTFSVVLDGDTIAYDLTDNRSLLSDLTPGKTYTWSVTAVEDDGSTEGPNWIFKVADDAVSNRLPIITLTSPPDGALIDASFVELTWNATDPDGDPMDYIVNVVKSNTDTFSFSANTTSFVMTDLTKSVTYVWWVIAYDGRSENQSEEWTFTVDSGIPNNAPILDKTPLPKAMAGKPYTYQLTAMDQDGNPLTFKLISGPPSLWVSANGTITWTPLKGGSFNLTVQVSDGKANDTYTYTLTVSDSEKNPPEELYIKMWPLYLVLLIMVGLVAAFTILRHRRTAAAAAAAAKSATVIDDIFLTYRDGRLINHHTRKLKPDTDVDIFTGMFKAVQDFLSESFRSEDQGKINEISYGNSKILIEHGKYVVIAAVVSGEGTKRTHEDMGAAIHNIELENGKVLEDWSGDASLLWDSKKWIKMLVNGERIKKMDGIPAPTSPQGPQRSPPGPGQIIE